MIDRPARRPECRADLGVLMAVAALVNGGHMIVPTFPTRNEADAMASTPPWSVSKPPSSMAPTGSAPTRRMWPASFANIEGYYVGVQDGKPRTKIIHGHYSRE